MPAPGCSEVALKAAKKLVAYIEFSARTAPASAWKSFLTTSRWAATRTSFAAPPSVRQKSRMLLGGMALTIGPRGFAPLARS